MIFLRYQQHIAVALVFLAQEILALHKACLLKDDSQQTYIFDDLELASAEIVPAPGAIQLIQLRPPFILRETEQVGDRDLRQKVRWLGVVTHLVVLHVVLRILLTLVYIVGP